MDFKGHKYIHIVWILQLPIISNSYTIFFLKTIVFMTIKNTATLTEPMVKLVVRFTELLAE